MLEKPTTDIDQIGRAIARLRIDATGAENTMHAVADVIHHYGGLVRKDRKLLIVLVTDESGDDGALRRGGPPGGHQPGGAALRDRPAVALRLRPGAPALHRPRDEGPLLADDQARARDGRRRDPALGRVQLPPGRAALGVRPVRAGPADEGRPAGSTSCCPSEETMRVRQREKAYSITDLKEYIPDYESRAVVRRAAERLGAAADAPRDHPGDEGLRHRARASRSIPDQLAEAGGQAVDAATQRLAVLINVEKKLRSLEKNRDRETDKRWQAAYDLMLAQVLAYEVKTYEYRACLKAMIKKPPKPSVMPKPDLGVDWGIGHSAKRQAPARRDGQEVRRGRPAPEARHRAPPQDPLGRPRPGHPRPRPLRRLPRAAPPARPTPATRSGPSSCPKF